MTTRIKARLCGIMLPVAAMLTDCNRIEEYYLTAYIQSYTIATGIKLCTEADNSLTIAGIYGEEEDGRRVTFTSNGADKELYDMICKEHGDTSYDRMVFIENGMFTVGSSYPDIVAIDIVADRDFDSQHPAGTNLNDCINISTFCAYRYIRSGYCDDSLSFVTVPLSEVEEDDLKVSLENYGELRFTREPDDKEGFYYLTATFRMSDGQTFTMVKKYDFNKEPGKVSWNEYIGLE